MTGHLLVPELDDVPATLSPRIVSGVLREELGFDGLVLSDALEMRAISGTEGLVEGALRALEAGVDALCLGRVQGEDVVESVHEAVVEAVRSGRIGADRVAEAAEADRPCRSARRRTGSRRTGRSGSRPRAAHFASEATSRSDRRLWSSSCSLSRRSPPARAAMVWAQPSAGACPIRT